MEKKLSREDKIEAILSWYEQRWTGLEASDLIDELRQLLVSGGPKGMKDWGEEELNRTFYMARAMLARTQGE